MTTTTTTLFVLFLHYTAPGLYPWPYAGTFTSERDCADQGETRLRPSSTKAPFVITSPDKYQCVKVEFKGPR
jgi:hypothetical protein